MQEQAYPVPDDLGSRPFFAVRKVLVSAGVTVTLGACSLVVRLLHPEHPFRIYTEGAMASHRETMGWALIPTQASRVRGETIITAAYVALAVVAVGFLIAVAASALAA